MKDVIWLDQETAFAAKFAFQLPDLVVAGLPQLAKGFGMDVDALVRGSMTLTFGLSRMVKAGTVM